MKSPMPKIKELTPLSKTAKKMLREAGFKESDLTPEERIALQDEADALNQGMMVLDGVLWWKSEKVNSPEGAMRE